MKSDVLKKILISAKVGNSTKWKLKVAPEYLVSMNLGKPGA